MSAPNALADCKHCGTPVEPTEEPDCCDGAREGVEASELALEVGKARRERDEALLEVERLQTQLGILLRASDDLSHGIQAPIGVARLKLQGTDYDAKFGLKAVAAVGLFLNTLATVRATLVPSPSPRPAPMPVPVPSNGVPLP